MAIKQEDLINVKGRGFLRNKGTDCFSGRVVSVGGRYTADQLKAIAECAQTFGNGNVCFTSRLSAEIVGIPYEKIPEAEAFLMANGLSFGGTGAKIRPVTACKGSTCVFGNIDTAGLAAEIHNRFYVGMKAVKLPHKFKIGVGGCPNSCMKPSLNDVGVEGCKIFRFDADVCRGCKACAIAKACPSKAVSFADGKAVIDPDKCHNCGVCLGKCPFGAVPQDADSRCKIYVGGTWGKTRRDGTLLSGTYSTDEVCDIIEKIILWYKENGRAKERFGNTVDRIGIAELEVALRSDSLILRKDCILSAPIAE